MKKYKVVTDSLDWVAVHRGDVISFSINDLGNFTKHFYSPNGSTETIICPKRFHGGFDSHIVDKYPDWFSEIKEDDKFSDNPMKALYTEKDMIAFGRLIRRTFNFTNSDSVVKSLLSDYKAAKFSPKEEPERSNYIINRELLNKWGDKSLHEFLLSVGVYKEDAPKEEEPKEFTKRDMENAFNAGHARGGINVRSSDILVTNFMSFEHWIKDYDSNK